ncbi:MAG: YdcF family protein [Alphaproteobacteria bacterium]|nr:YdcF family protein [Alphaproteobacteria bacterium]
MSKKSTKLTVFLIVLVFLFCLWMLGFMLFSNYVFKMSEDTTVYPKSNKAGITVLTGGRNRIAKAITMLNQEKGARLLISGVKEDISLEDIIKREDVALKTSLPIDLGKQATDTLGNAKEIKLWSEKYKINKIYVVTSFYHIPRSGLEIEHIVKDKELIYVPVCSDYVSPNWWENLSSFEFLAREYTKFLIVYVQYKVLGL